MAVNPYNDLMKLKEENTSLENKYMEEGRKIQEDQINQNTQNVISDIEKQKEYVDKDLNSASKAQYAQYKKSINPFGVENEKIYEGGLSKSGFSESSKVKNYNQMQGNISMATDSANRMKADFDSQINEAKISGNASLAQLALAEYQQKIDNLWRDYEYNVDLQSKKYEWEKVNPYSSRSSSNSASSKSYTNYNFLGQNTAMLDEIYSQSAGIENTNRQINPYTEYNFSGQSTTMLDEIYKQLHKK